MENNCLVTKLKANVNDNSLLKIGEMRLEAGTFTETYGKRIKFTTYPQVIETLDGSASLTFDSNLLTGFTNKLTLSADNQIFYTKNQDVVIVVPNKYDIKGILCKNTTINLDNLKYSPSLTSLENLFCKGSLESIKDKSITYLVGLKFEQEQDIINLSGFSALKNLNILNSTISGDISALSGLTALTTLGLGNAQISGNISALSGLTNLTNIVLSNTQISGNISALSGLTNLTNLSMGGTSVSGDIQSLGTLTNLTNIVLSNTSVSGDIQSLGTLTNLTNIVLINTSVSGDIQSLGTLTNLTNINLGRAPVFGNIQSLGSLTALIFMELVNLPNITGEIIDYVISQRSHGRTSGNTRFGPSNTVKFNGKVLSDYNNISWTESTITNETTSETVNR